MAVTTVHGLADPQVGARNVARLLKLLGHQNVPVYIGAARSTHENRRFPQKWREETEALRGVSLPEVGPKCASTSAAKFLTSHFMRVHGDIQLLALGPLTNIAEALQLSAGNCELSHLSVTSMGGAFAVPGNLRAGDGFETDNLFSEWNFYVDPWAADLVLRSNINLTLVPLDATNCVPISSTVLTNLHTISQTPAALFTLELLSTIKHWIQEGHYFAWDPLAAAIVVQPCIATFISEKVTIDLGHDHSGRTTFSKLGAYARVAVAADPVAFEQTFISTLSRTEST